jgi:hypothetical protein
MIASYSIREIDEFTEKIWTGFWLLLDIFYSQLDQNILNYMLIKNKQNLKLFFDIYNIDWGKIN